MLRLLISFVLILNSLPVFSEGSAFPIADSEKSTVVAGKESRIVVGDIININVFPAQEFSREVTVQPDGTVEMSLVGSIKVEGLTIEELETKLTAKLSKFIANPQITINIRRFALNQISIIGDIRNPGHFDYRPGMKMLDLVALAGGLQDNAQSSRVRVLRRGAATRQEQSFSVNLKAILEGDLNRDVPLSPGDIVYIPKKKFAVGSKWLTDNIVPWATLITLGVTVSLAARR